MEFMEELFRIMERKTHPSIDYIHWHGTPEQLFTEAQQVYPIIKNFSAYLRRVASKIKEADSGGRLEEVINELEQNIREEEKGAISGFNQPHKDLFLHTMSTLGYDTASFENAALLPETRKYMNWLDDSIREEPWQVDFAVTGLFVEGSPNERKELGLAKKMDYMDNKEKMIYIRGMLKEHHLVKHFGLEPKDLKLKIAHLLVEGSHRQAAHDTILSYVPKPDDQKRVIEVMNKTLSMWLGYRNGIARACNLPRQYLT